jgi:hypothetical protein
VNFRAKLKQNSTIYRRWMGASRVGGMISGVEFKRQAKDFVSVADPLPPDAVSTLLHHHMVELEVSTAPIGSVVVVENEDDGQPDDGENQPEGEADDGPAETPDPIAALWRSGEPKQEPVMRRPRGRPPGPR